MRIRSRSRLGSVSQKTVHFGNCWLSRQSDKWSLVFCGNREKNMVMIGRHVGYNRIIY